MEPTIYEPSIYKGAGIYKTGDNGGGGVNEITDINGEIYIIKNYIKTLAKSDGVSPLYTNINTNINYNDKLNFEFVLNKFSDGEAYKTLLQRKANVGGYNRNFADGIAIRLNFFPPGYFRIYGDNGGNSAIGADYQKDFLNSNIVDGEKYTLSISPSGILFNPNISSNPGTNPAFNNVTYSSIRLLGNNETMIGSGCFEYPFYGLIIKDNTDKIKFNYRPVIRKIDSKIGFFDLANLIFYPSSYSDNDLSYIEVS